MPAAGRPPGADVRCCARVVKSATPSGAADTSLFIAGNALELVPAGKTEGERHSYSRIFDEYASDKDVYETEVLPLLEALTNGENAGVVVMGYHRSGHSELVNKLVPLMVDRIFELMQQRQAVAGGRGGQLMYQLYASVASVVIGSTDKMSDMLAQGSSELRVVRDAEAPSGVQLPGVRKQQVPSGPEFAKTFSAARVRLQQQHRPPAPSSVLILELVQSVHRGGGAAGSGEAVEEMVSQLVLTDIEVGSLGDPLASGLRAVLSTPPTKPLPLSGCALLLGEAVGGNARGLLLGCVVPGDMEESATTLGLLAHGMGFRNYPLVNNATTRGLLQRQYWHIQTLGESLATAEFQIRRGVDAVGENQKHLPSQLSYATDKLQALVDAMQQDSAGTGGERQQLMAEVMSLRTRLNQSTGEAVQLKHELVREKEQKMELTRQLLSAQLNGGESTAKEQQRVFELEVEALAARDILQSVQRQAMEKEKALLAADAQLAQVTTKAEKLERRCMALEAELHGLQTASTDWREREDELMLQVRWLSDGSWMAL